MRYPVCKEFRAEANNCYNMSRIGYRLLDAENEHDQEKEHFWVIVLDTRLRVKYIELVSLGTLDASLVHPREVFRLACEKGASAIAIMHNHPSGELAQSRQDIEVTQRLIEAGRVLGINVIDHVIIGDAGNDKYLSFANEGIVRF